MACELPFHATKEVVIETFILSMDNIDSHTVDLRKEAKIAMDHLTGLEERLTVLRKVAHSYNKDILADPWTLFGGNERNLGKMDRIFDSLEIMEKWKRKALSHVVTTLQILRTLDADMKKLRERVAVSYTVGDKIPVEVQVGRIKLGTERLKGGQAGARSR